jgi:hypothetical protein
MGFRLMKDPLLPNLVGKFFQIMIVFGSLFSKKNMSSMVLLSLVLWVRAPMCGMELNLLFPC